MNRHAALMAGLALLAALPAQARDERLSERLYNPDEVVRVEGRSGVQAVIAFAEDEHIENVAIGDSTKWQVTPNKRANLLFVKPLDASARTNMTVVTDRHAYYFDLVSGTKGKPLYSLRFTYRPEPESADAKGQAAADMDRPVDPANLAFDWIRKGKASLYPVQIYDDGQSTYLAWPADRSVPAILVANEKGEEGPVNYAVRDGVIVIGGVPRQIVLRSGKAAATLEKQVGAETARKGKRTLAAAPAEGE